MQGLFDPARHEPLRTSLWSAAAVRTAIAAMAGAAERALDPRGRPAHPQDDATDPATHYFNLYEGSGGVLWALHRLQAAGAIDSGIDFAAATARLLDRNRATLVGAQHGQASFLLGDAGLLLLRWHLADDAAAAAALYDCVEGNLHNPVREALWGNPGTVLAAIHVAEATGDARWRALVQRALHALHDEMEREPESGCWVWVQDLYGRRRCLLGAGHGFVGNVYPFLRARSLLDDATTEMADRVVERALQTLQATMLAADGVASWQPGIDQPRTAGKPPLVQDCHGAPGVVSRLAEAPRTAAWDALLRAAGELTWQAGPLVKGPTLCHGTAGNAYAFLKLWRRFEEPVWLDRARAFAMHAITQVETARQRHSRTRDSLWTGDLGVACLLWSCLQGDDRYPTLDVF